MVDTNDRPRKRGYARIERERRFVVAQLPEFVHALPFERLVDRYIEGTQLRLRRIEAADGALVLVKLGQKRPDPAAPDDPRRQEMTTFYLRPEDAEVLAQLPARCSTKRRYAIAEQGATFVLDVYEAPESASGILVAEVECDDDAALDRIECPRWAEREVTDDPSYSGARLAR